jgi:hypothetical protein
VEHRAADPGRAGIVARSCRGFAVAVMFAVVVAETDGSVAAEMCVAAAEVEGPSAFVAAETDVSVAAALCVFAAGVRCGLAVVVVHSGAVAVEARCAGAVVAPMSAVGAGVLTGAVAGARNVHRCRGLDHPVAGHRRPRTRPPPAVT